MSDGFNPEKSAISGEVMYRRTSLQKRVMELMLPNVAEHNKTRATLDWIDDYSPEFSVIFDRRMEKEADFLDRCLKNEDAVAEDIVYELRSK